MTDLRALTDGLPEPVRAAWETQDLDAVVAWLRSPDHAEGFPPEADGLALTVAEIMIPVEPEVAADLFRTLVARATEPEERASLLQRLMDGESRLGHSEELCAAFEELCSALTDLDSPEFISAALNNAATFLKAGGLYDEAETTLRTLLDSPPLQEPLPPWLRGTLLVNLATVLADRAQANPAGRRADLASALAALDEAEQAAAEGESPRLRGNVWFNRGHILAVSSQPAAAARAYAEAWSAFDAAGGDPADLGYVRRAQAADAARNGRLPDAVAFYEEARTHFMDAGLLDEAARTTVGLVMAMAGSEGPPSREHLDNLLDVVRQTLPREAPQLLVNVGNILSTWNPAEALRIYRQAAVEFRATGQERDRTRARHSQALMIRRLGNPAGALRILDTVRARYAAWGLEVQAAEVDFNRALTLRDLGSPNEALDSSLRALEVLDAHRHLLGNPSDRAALVRKTYPHLHDLSLDLARALDARDLVAALAERARVQTTPHATAVPGSWQLAPPPPVRARPGARGIGGAGAGVVLSDLAHALAGTGSTWVGWVRHRERLVRVVVTPSGTHASDVPWPADLLLDLRDALADVTDEDRALCPDDDAARRALYRAATGPLLDDPQLADRLRPTLAVVARCPWEGRAVSSASELLVRLAEALVPASLADGVGRVVLAPPPFLGRIPWAALSVGGRPWAEGRELVVAPPVGTLRTNTRATPVPSRRLWVADPRGDLPHCRATPAAGWTVLSASGPTPSADRATPPTRAAVLDLLAGRDVSTLVVRGHVRPGSAADPGSTAILLADGELTARELQTAGVPMPPTCVVLGCDAAGAATGEEWAGLPIGLGAAGAGHVVVTQWPVVDDAEQEALDLALTAAISGAGAGGLWAWQREQARAWRTGEPGRSAPYRWASLVLVVTSRAGVDALP